MEGLGCDNAWLVLPLLWFFGSGHTWAIIAATLRRDQLPCSTPGLRERIRSLASLAAGRQAFGTRELREQDR